MTVTSVVGQTETDAKNTITNAGLNVGTVTYEASSEYAEGIVIKQTPSDGTQVARNSNVNLVVSSEKLRPRS